jgi:hypothetical protein
VCEVVSNLSLELLSVDKNKKKGINSVFGARLLHNVREKLGLSFAHITHACMRVHVHLYMCFVEKRNPEPFNTNEYIARTGVQDLV